MPHSSTCAAHIEAVPSPLNSFVRVDTLHTPLLLLLHQAMDGSMNLEQALEERLRIINCTPADIKRFIQAHPPSSRMVPVRAAHQHTEA